MSPHRSKLLSLILRHSPEKFNVVLDAEGWVAIEELTKSTDFTTQEIEDIVAGDNKQRYSILNGKVRANQGHSTSMVNITFEQKVPPSKLYHGTTRDVVASIMKQGLLPGSRQYVHLSEEVQTAVRVGNRRNRETVVLEIDTAVASLQGASFFQSDNGVWLTKHVPTLAIKESSNG